MSVRNYSDQGFDDYRRERKRMRAKIGPQPTALGYENSALRELEQVEAQEVRDQQLTREVHEFFATATRQAAAIVEKVARDAQQEAGQRVEQEMESFLIDALTRMNNFVLAVLQVKRGGVAETQMEPKIGNHEGNSLDEFRWSGTAEVADKHIGQDPFATDVDDVRREFRTQVGENSADGPPVAVPIDQHLVAAVTEDGSADGRAEDDASDAPADAPAPATAVASAKPHLPPAPAPVTRTTMARAATPIGGGPKAAPSAPEASKGAGDAGASDPAAELERFKGALKALVRQGVMSRDEARAAWDARLAALGHGSKG
jgi:hypothetical protein